MMPKKETKTLVIIILLVNVLSIGIFIFLYYYTTNLITESVNVENDIKIELKKQDIRGFMKNDLTLGKMYQEKLTSYMIPSGGTVDFIKTLEQLVLNSGLKSDIKNVSTVPYDKGNSIGTELMLINIDVTGEWKNIQFFLTLLGNYPLKIDMNKLSLSKFSDYVIRGRNVPQWVGSFEFTIVKVKDTK